MTFRQILQRFRDARQDLDRVAGDGVGESVDGLMQRWGERFHREPLEGLDQRVRETVQPVAVADDGFTLYLV